MRQKSLKSNQIENESQEEPKNEPIGETLDFNNPDFKFTPSGRHDWRQEGPYLVCRSCVLTHATWIGIENMMVGVDKDGNPIIKSRKELGMA